MKTSLVIDERVFEDAKKESLRTGKSLSEIISEWASLGRELWKKKGTKKLNKFVPLNLGVQKIDLNNRKEWMESLEDDGN
jgi:hypothetical protein